MTDLKDADRLRRGFRLFNRFMLVMWRLGLGKLVNIWPQVGGQIMVLVHTGRRSGQTRRTPVNYVRVNGDVYCTAGFGERSDWYRNLCANPQVEVWLPEGRYAGTAEDISDSPERLAWMRRVLIASGFAARAAGINPHNISDSALSHATGGYRLVRIRLTEPLHDPGGPGDLMWVWPLTGAALLLAILVRRRESSERLRG